MASRFASIGPVVIATLIAACGGGGGGNPEPAPSPPKQALDLVVSGSTDPLAVSASRQLVATVRYSDGTTTAVTSTANWSSSDPGVASFSSAPGEIGKLAAVGEGSTVVTATWSGLTGSTRVQVGTPVVRIELAWNGSATGAPGEPVQFQAYAHFASKGTRFATPIVQWTSSNPTVATVGSANGSPGLVQGVAPGRTLISATLDSVVATIEFEVLPIRLLAQSLTGVTAPALAAGHTSDGRSIVAYTELFTGGNFPKVSTVLRWTRTAGQPWPDGELINAGVNDGGRPTAPTWAFNPKRQHGVLAWAAQGGVFAASYNEGAWRRVQAVLAGTSDTVTVGQPPQIVVDDSGNALAVFVNGLTGQLVGSRYSSGTDAWTIPTVLPGFDSGVATGAVRLVGTPDGRALAVWLRVQVSTGGPGQYSLWASTFDPLTGWTPAEVVLANTGALEPDLAMNAQGQAILVATDRTPAPGAASVIALQYSPSLGWSAVDTLARSPASSELDALQPTRPRAWIGPDGDVIVAWGHAYDGSIVARRSASGGSWQALEVLYAGSAGTPEVLPIFGTASGRLFVSWVQGAGWVASRRFVPGLGWDPINFMDRLSHKGGSVADIAFAFDDAGRGTVAWIEGYDRPGVDGIYRRYNDLFVDDGLEF